MERHTKQAFTEIKPYNFIVFGGDGDLAMKKIYPALFQRELDEGFDKNHALIPIFRKEQNEKDFLKVLESSLRTNCLVKFTENEINQFFKNIFPIHIGEGSTENYNALKFKLSEIKNRQSIFYFSTPSHAFGEIAKNLKDHGLIDEQSKVVLEKPLGYSLESSNEINKNVTQAFKESQIYRIDHYLGKETVQNLMVLRFANNLFESAWDSEHIENIQITVAESIGVEKRASYYDNSGALLDMVQNHLLQLLCLVAMEPPLELEANDVRTEKLKVLKALRPFTKKSVQQDTVKGQYTRGNVLGKEVSSYLEDIGKYNSKTETFVALKTYIDNWRWKDVPFYLRTGKRMPKRFSEIVINFKEVKHNIFPSKEQLNNNKLIIRLQPEERIELIQMTKIPGPGGYRYKPIALKLDYLDSFKERLPDAYERLIVDVIRGNQTLFMSQDELQAAWVWIESITNNWKLINQSNILYEAGSWGPGESILDAHTSWVTKNWKD
jgi:glucose-6-phosphate 1-dehydrogenase